MVVILSEKIRRSNGPGTESSVNSSLALMRWREEGRHISLVVRPVFPGGRRAPWTFSFWINHFHLWEDRIWGVRPVIPWLVV